MAHKENQKAFVVTFPLRTEKWQEDRIDKMMRMLTTFYNDRQRKLVRRYIYLSHSKAYKEAKGKGVVAFKNYMKENPNVKQEEVAIHSGFSSSSYFSRVFSRFESMTPAAWRKEQNV